MLSRNFNFKHKISDHDLSKKSFIYNRREGEENLGENVHALFNMSIILFAGGQGSMLSRKNLNM